MTPADSVEVFEDGGKSFGDYLWVELYNRGYDADVLTEYIWGILADGNSAEVLQAYFDELNPSNAEDNITLAYQLHFYFHNPTADHSQGYEDSYHADTSLSWTSPSMLSSSAQPLGYSLSELSLLEKPNHSSMDSFLTSGVAVEEEPNSDLFDEYDDLIGHMDVTFLEDDKESSESLAASSLLNEAQHSHQQTGEEEEGTYYEVEADEEEIYYWCENLQHMLSNHVDDLTFTGGHSGTLYAYDVLYAALYHTGFEIVDAARLIRHNENIISEQRPCYNALAHKCYRKDCSFVHDFKKLPCKFWLTFPTGCSDPVEECPFVHDLILPEGFVSVNAAAEEEKPIDVINNILDFPELGSTTARKSSATKKKDGKDPITKPVDIAPATDATKNSNSKSAKTIKIFVKNFNSRGGNFVSTGKAFSDAVKQPGSSATGSNMSADPNKSRANMQVNRTVKTLSSLGSRKILPQHWVEGGEAVRNTYVALREEARSLAIARNKCLEEASKAYLGGSGELAKKLSRKGHDYNVEMKKCHAEAAKQIFIQRNPTAALSRGQIDLHGLHVTEADICLRDILPHFQQQGIVCVTVVTGSGHHAVGGRAKVLPCVINLCQELKYGYQQIADRNGFAGALRIVLQ